MTAPTVPATASCPTCDGSGERVRCPRRCDGSHVLDEPYRCDTCGGTGEATASARLAAAADRLDEWPAPYAAPLAELLRHEALHAADLEAASTTWDRYPADTALLVQIADGIHQDTP